MPRSVCPDGSAHAWQRRARPLIGSLPGAQLRSSRHGGTILTRPVGDPVFASTSCRCCCSNHRRFPRSWRRSRATGWSKRDSVPLSSDQAFTASRAGRTRPLCAPRPDARHRPSGAHLPLYPSITRAPSNLVYKRSIAAVSGARCIARQTDFDLLRRGRPTTLHLERWAGCPGG